MVQSVIDQIRKPYLTIDVYFKKCINKNCSHDEIDFYCTLQKLMQFIPLTSFYAIYQYPDLSHSTHRIRFCDKGVCPVDIIFHSVDKDKIEANYIIDSEKYDSVNIAAVTLGNLLD